MKPERWCIALMNTVFLYLILISTSQAIRTIVEDALSQFSADRVGMPDFALESAGGSVVNVRCSETYYRKTAQVSVFGLPLWYTSNSPRTVIQVLSYVFSFPYDKLCLTHS